MKIFKFGGASIQNLERIQQTAKIIDSHKNEKLLIVVSALGKTTNALEAVTQAFFNDQQSEALQLFQTIKESHNQLNKFLTNIHWQRAENQLKDFYTEIEWLLHDSPVRNYDYYYDQIVCCGELFSSALLYNHLCELGANAAWVDVRDIIRTDNNFRDASIDWAFTEKNIAENLQPLFSEHNIIITQGFIGSTDENESTTLGREGSDYSAAIFANLLNAATVTIWKDVDAVMNADPRRFEDATKIHHLNYAEVIEMAYYGAQVIHPKTIKPLQNKQIPLLVKSFIDPSLEGTRIDGKSVKHLPPVYVVKENQVLMQFKSTDYSFVGDAPIAQLHKMYEEVKIKPNISQNTAISLLCSFDYREEKIALLAEKASSIFDVSIEKDLTLFTIRHYTPESIAKLVQNKTIILEQKTLETIQMLVRNSA